MKRSDIDDRKMDSCDDEDGDSDSSYQSESGRSGKHTDRKITSNNSGVGQQAGSSGVSGGDECGQSSSEIQVSVECSPRHPNKTNEESSTLTVGYHALGTLGEAVDLPAYVKEHSTTLTFPEKLMLTLTHVERMCVRTGKRESSESIGWVLDGKAFVIRNKDKLCKTWVPMFFGEAKFSSFTRKLYRWGFRKVNLAPQAMSPTALYFGNENFQRDNKAMLSRMRSITAAKTRSEMAADSVRHPIPIPPSAVVGFPSHAGFPLNHGLSYPPFQVNQSTEVSQMPQVPTPEQAAILQQAMALAQLAIQSQQIQLPLGLPNQQIQPHPPQPLPSQSLPSQPHAHLYGHGQAGSIVPTLTQPLTPIDNTTNHLLDFFRRLSTPAVQPYALAPQPSFPLINSSYNPNQMIQQQLPLFSSVGLQPHVPPQAALQPNQLPLLFSLGQTQPQPPVASVPVPPILMQQSLQQDRNQQSTVEQQRIREFIESLLNYNPTNNGQPQLPPNPP